MPKSRAPLHSLGAKGGLGSQLVYLRRLGQHIVRQHVIPHDPETVLQLVQRTKFQDCVSQWHDLTDEQKEEYRLVDPTIGTNAGYLNFMRECLLAEVEEVAGEGHITILPLSYQSIVQGTWALVFSSLYWFRGCFRNTTSNDGDSLSFKVYLDAGTYTLMQLSRHFSSAGIVDYYIDDEQVASFDLYDAIDVKNSIDTQANIVVATAGLKTLTLKLDGKNPSSNDYFLYLQYTALWRTA